MYPQGSGVLSDWYALLGLMLPTFVVAMGTCIAVYNALMKTRPRADLVIAWLVTPVVVWSYTTIQFQRRPACLNGIFEPLLLIAFAIGVYLWAKLATTPWSETERELAALSAVNVVAFLIGAFIPAVGESV